MLKQKIKFSWYSFARLNCLAFSRIFFKYKIIDLKNIPSEGAFILVCNHQSFLDPVFCASPITRQMNFLARDTLFKNPFFGWLIASLNVTPLRMGEADLSAMKTIIKKLKEGQPVLLYPEATRTSDGRISPFKSGLGLLCRRGNAPIIPMLVEGAFECWPRHKKLFTIGKKITVRYGFPISAEQVGSITDEQLADLLTKTIRQFQADARLNEGKIPFKYE